MKKRYFLLPLILLLVLLVTACDKTSKQPDNQSGADTPTLPETHEETKIPVELDGSEGLEYHVYQNGTCSVSGIGTCTDKNLVIPTVSPDGYSVVGIEKAAFKGNRDILTLTIPESVREIEEDAFAECTRLMSVRFPSTKLAFIGNTAFKDCAKLVEVIAPDHHGITLGSHESGYVAYYARFVHSEPQSKLLEENDYVYIDVDNRHYLLDYVGEDTELVLPAYEGAAEYYIYLRAFYGRTELTAVTLPEELDGISGQAFFGCTGLTEMTIPASVKNYSTDFYDLMGYHFGGCTSLTAVTFAEGTEWIPGYLFDANTPLKNVTIPEGATLLCAGAFKDCTALETVYLPASMTDIDEKAFSGCTSLKEIRLPDGLESVANYLFEGCTGLTSIKIPDSVTAIWGGAFSGCKNLETVELPASLTLINSNVFENCVSLKNITFPEGLRQIDNDAFIGCVSLEAVVIPNSVTELSSAFGFCEGLKTVTLPGNIKNCNENAFIGCNQLEEIIISEGTESLSVKILKIFKKCGAVSKLSLPLSLRAYDSNFYLLKHLVDDIYYPGTEEQFLQITGHNYFLEMERCTIHFEYSHEVAE